MHNFLKLAYETGIDFSHTEITFDDLQHTHGELTNLRWDIGYQMEEDYPNELELAHDLFF